MSEAATEEITTTSAAFKAAVEGALKVQREEFKTEMATALAARETGPVRQPVATGGDNRTDEDPKRAEMREHARGIIVREGWESDAVRHYATDRSVPESQRTVRNVETDHFIAEWFRAIHHQDFQRQARAAEFFNVRVDGNLQTGVGNLGGDLLPQPFSDQVYVQQQLNEVMAPLCTRFTHDHGRMTIPKELRTDLLDAVGKAETSDTGAGGGTDTPLPVLGSAKFGQLVLDTKKGDVTILVSDEMLEQPPYQIVTNLAAQAGRAHARRSDDQIVVLGDGTGTNHTDSLTNNSDVNSATVGTAFDAAKVLDMWGLPIAGHRANGIYLADAAALRVLNKVLGPDGRVIFTPADAALSALVAQGQGVAGIGTMVGRPVFEVNSTAGLLLFGDPRAIAVLDDGKGMRSKVEVIPLMDTTAFRWQQSRDSGLLEGTAWARTSVAIAI